jgi:UDP-2,4-diacetamido-2,4,6-trideoxy-beta-L-altropyranose hydrolase
VKVAFRVDASLKIGTGHVVRCLTLADELRRSGAECVFLCRDHAGNLVSVLRQQGHAVSAMPVGLEDHIPQRGDTELPTAARVAVEQDAKFALETLAPWNPDWLIVDHYGIDVDWEQMVRSSVRHLMVIDDLADRRHDCDLLLDQNLVAKFETRYEGLVPGDCRLLLGPSFALLQPQYAELHTKIRERRDRVRRVLVYFGGADRNNLTGMVVDAFLALQPVGIELDVVINSTNPHAREIEARITGRPGLTLHTDLPSLASLMEAADLAFGAGGATTWERCCLGLPSIVITLADNQVPIASELNRRGLIRWLGRQEEVSCAKVREALDAALREGLSGAWSESCRQVVDGRGTRRVADLLKLENWN